MADSTVAWVEAFESFVAVAIESEGFVVSEAVKFPVTLVTRKAAYKEVQTHGFEVDLVGARADRLVLATVKSFFGSQGVRSDHVTATSSNRAACNRYRLLNDPVVRETVISEAAERYGYALAQVELRLYAGRFAAPTTGNHEAEIRRWCASLHAGGGPIQVYGVQDVVTSVQRVAASTQYRDNPVLVTMKVLEAANLLRFSLPNDIGGDSDEALVEET